VHALTPTLGSHPPSPEMPELPGETRLRSVPPSDVHVCSSTTLVAYVQLLSFASENRRPPSREKAR